MAGKRFNPHNFILKSDCRSKIEPLPQSPLLIVGRAFNSGQYYVLCVDPDPELNYKLYENIASSQGKFTAVYAEITDQEEKRAIDTFFLSKGILDYYYRLSNWEFPIQPLPAPDAGTKQGKYYSIKSKQWEIGDNKYANTGNILIPRRLKEQLDQAKKKS